MYRQLSGVVLSVAVVAAPLCHGLGFMAGFNGHPPAALSARATRFVPSAVTPTNRVMLVVVDGLRADKVPLLHLPPPDAHCDLQTVLPSFSRPAYVALSTGVPPALSGVETNDHEGPALLESIWDVARSALRPTHLVADGTDWWVTLFPNGYSQIDVIDKAAFHDWLAAAPAPLPGEVTLVHIVAVDDAGHDYGAMSEAYDAEAIVAGAEIRTLMGRLDLAHGDLLMVTADHGHIDRGGHGGPEPEVMNIALDAYGPVTPTACRGSLLDVPATIAAAIDVPPPAASSGHALPILTTPHLRPSSFTPLAVPEVRASSTTGLVLAVLALLVLLAVALQLVARGGRDSRVRLVFAALLWPLVAVVAYLVLEPTLSLSAVWKRDPWTLRMIALFGVPALLTALVVFGRLVVDRWGGLVLWSLGALLPFAAALGLHGSLAAGPGLGDPHAAFALIVSDLIATVGAGVGLLVVIALALLARRGVRQP